MKFEILNPESPSERRDYEHRAMLHDKCAKQVERLDDPDDEHAQIEAAKAVVLELASLGIKQPLWRARDTIVQIVRDRADDGD